MALSQLRSVSFAAVALAAMLVGACSPETRALGRSGAPGPAATVRAGEGDASRTNARVEVAPELAVTDAGALDGRVDAGRAPAVPKPNTFANLDPDDDLIVGPPEPFGDCEARLTKAGIAYTLSSLPVHTEKKGRITCGAPEVVVYRGGPGKIAYRPQPVLTCGMALALAYYETLMQSEALAELGSPIVRIDQLGTYACREVAAYPGTVSEHAYANAIDLARFTLKSGAVVEVLRDFDAGGGEPKRPQGRFLRKISRRGNDEDVFSHVLTSFFNPAHKDHFHLDLARYRQDGTR